MSSFIFIIKSSSSRNGRVEELLRSNVNGRHVWFDSIIESMLVGSYNALSSFFSPSSVILFFSNFNQRRFVFSFNAAANTNASLSDKLLLTKTKHLVEWLPRMKSAKRLTPSIPNSSLDTETNSGELHFAIDKLSNLLIFYIPRGYFQEYQHCLDHMQPV